MPFCSSCGAQTTGTFCSKCGKPVSGLQAPPVGQATPPAATARKTSPIVWVLVIVLGFIVLCGLGAATVGFMVTHRLHQAGVSFDRTRGGFAIEGRNGRVEFGSEGSLPSWVPGYPSSTAKFAVRAQDTNGRREEGGEFTFTTSDSASQVLSFYRDRCKEQGMTVNLSAATDEGGTVVATDDAGRRKITVVLSERGNRTTAVVTYGRKDP
jgi:hypothetical protein